MQESNELTIIQLFSAIKRQVQLLKKRILWILIPSIILSIGAYYKEKLSTTQYTARASFSISSNNQDGISSMLSIANQFGIKVGDINEVNNFTLASIVSSKTAIFSSLLTPYLDPQTNKEDLFINRFFRIEPKYKNSSQLNFAIKKYNLRNLSEYDDSILCEVYSIMLKKYLDVVVDEKEHVIDFSVTSNDRLFSRDFSNQVLKYVNSYFVENKLKQQNFTIDLMQNKADSIFKLLEAKRQELAISIDASSRMVRTVGKLTQLSSGMDVQILQQMYIDAVKNLELSKLSMASTNVEHLFIVDEPNISIESVIKNPLKIGVITFLSVSIILSFIILATRYFSELTTEFEDKNE
jgi:hypothetical protein